MSGQVYQNHIKTTSKPHQNCIKVATNLHEIKGGMFKKRTKKSKNLSNNTKIWILLGEICFIRKQRKNYISRSALPLAEVRGIPPVLLLPQVLPVMNLSGAAYTNQLHGNKTEGCQRVCFFGVSNGCQKG